MNTGWSCPKCGLVHGPTVTFCGQCARTAGPVSAGKAKRFKAELEKARGNAAHWHRCAEEWEARVKELEAELEAMTDHRDTWQNATEIEREMKRKRAGERQVLTDRVAELEAELDVARADSRADRDRLADAEKVIEALCKPTGPLSGARTLRVVAEEEDERGHHHTATWLRRVADALDAHGEAPEAAPAEVPEGRKVFKIGRATIEEAASEDDGYFALVDGEAVFAMCVHDFHAVAGMTLAPGVSRRVYLADAPPEKAEGESDDLRQELGAESEAKAHDEKAIAKLEAACAAKDEALRRCRNYLARPATLSFDGTSGLIDRINAALAPAAPAEGAKPDPAADLKRQWQEQADGQ